MADQAGLDVRGRDPQSADLDHVVDATLVDEVALGRLHVAIAGEEPVAAHAVARLLALVPVEGGAALAAHEQVARLAGRDLVRRRRRRAAARSRAPAVPTCPGAGRRACSSSRCAASRSSRSRRGSACRSAPPSARSTAAGSGSAADRHARTLEKSVCAERRRPSASRRTGRGRRRTASGGARATVSRIRLGLRAAHDLHRGRAGRERERQAVAQAVGVEQLRRRVADVVLADPPARGGRRCRSWRRCRGGCARRPSAFRSSRSCRARRPCRRGACRPARDELGVPAGDRLARSRCGRRRRR